MLRKTNGGGRRIQKRNALFLTGRDRSSTHGQKECAEAMARGEVENVRREVGGWRLVFELGGRFLGVLGGRRQGTGGRERGLIDLVNVREK